MTSLVLQSVNNKDLLVALGDHISFKIIQSVIHEPRTCFEIKTINNIPQTSCYRKINHLVNQGILVKDGYRIINDKTNRVKVIKYRAFTDKIILSVSKEGVLFDTRNCFKGYFQP